VAPLPAGPGGYIVARRMKRVAALGGAVTAGVALAATVMSTAFAASAVSARPVWAVGNTTTFNGGRGQRPLIERLEGGSWKVMSNPKVIGGSLAAVVGMGRGNAWAVGSFGPSTRPQALIERWTGSAWRQVSGPRPPAGSYLLALAGVSQSDVWAVGGTGIQGLSGSTLIEHWDGSSWHEVTSPSLGPASGRSQTLNGVAAVSANDAWAVGYSGTSRTQRALIEHWDGSSWSHVPSPNVGPSRLSGVSAVSSRNVWAVGLTYSLKHAKTLVEHWNGSSWKRVRSPSPGAYPVLTSVAALSSRSVWAVGNTYTGIGGSWHTLIEHWNGSSWKRVASPTPPVPTDLHVYLTGVTAPSPTKVFAVGYYDTGRAWLTLGERWDGRAWHRLRTANPRSANFFNGVG